MVDTAANGRFDRASRDRPEQMQRADRDTGGHHAPARRLPPRIARETAMNRQGKDETVAVRRVVADCARSQFRYFADRANADPHDFGDRVANEVMQRLRSVGIDVVSRRTPNRGNAMTETLSEHYTVAEIAEKLKYSDEKVRRAIRKHKICYLGTDQRDMRLNPHQVTALLEAMGEPCRSVLSNAEIATNFSSKAELRATPNAYAAALKALAPRSRAKRRPPSRLRSSARSGTESAVALDPSPKKS
jgi:hypothetical protein